MNSVTVHVVLMHNRLAGEFLLNASHESYEFHSMLEDVPRAAVTTPFQYTELVVNNLPTPSEVPQVERKLEELVRAWHGKLKYHGR